MNPLQFCLDFVKNRMVSGMGGAVLGTSLSIMNLSVVQAQMLTPASEDALHQLETYLQQRDWEGADGETWRLSVEVVDMDDTGGMITFQNLSCDRLNGINDLWEHYSDGQFGFRVQGEIVAQNGDDLSRLDQGGYKRLATAVGWKTGDPETGQGYRRYRSLEFSSQAPRGQFPASPWRGYRYRQEFGTFVASNRELGERIATCSDR